MKDTLTGIFRDLDGTSQWQAELVRNGWTDALLTGDPFSDFLAEQDRNVQEALASLGVRRRAVGSSPVAGSSNVTEQEIIQFTAHLPGVDVLTAGEVNGAPEIAWGDSFFYFDPDQSIPADKRFPFATIVTKDYPAFDEMSKVDRDGVFRLNISVGRRTFEELLGYPPSGHVHHESDFDYAATDALIPHPVYATQGWVSIVSPGEHTDDLVQDLLIEAHGLAAARYRPRGSR